tara:strand:- start:1001 stop:1918 length:918 start_codon:yes stop_codon:yes gene_type:complete
MGLLDNQNQYQYYTDVSKYGNYQFITLENIINGFMIQYVGEDKVFSKASRTDVQFHAMRAIQELSYDVFRSVKSYEIEVPNTLKVILPHDYVNYVSLSLSDNGIKKRLYPTSKTSNPAPIKPSGDGSSYLSYDDNDNDGLEDELNTGDGNPYVHADSTTWDNYKGNSNSSNNPTSDSTDIELSLEGRRYGLDPQHANANGSFYIDQLRGYIHLSSNVSGKNIVLDYISDGLGTDEEMIVHKFCEEAIYKWIAYGVASCRANIPDPTMIRFKMEKATETRKAKIRLSNIKIEEFTQVLKGVSKIIK